MLVVMDQDAAPAKIECVKSWIERQGLRAEVLDGDPAVVDIFGTLGSELIDELRSKPGVAGLAGIDKGEAPVTSNLRIAAIRPLVPPQILQEALPLPPKGAFLVQESRQQIARILNGEDDRVVVVVGPCSIHDPEAALEYSARLATLAEELAGDLAIVMRVYFEKPRTTVGWKGLINDPGRDNSFAVNEGLSMARQFLLDVIALGLPAGCEFLDPITPQFIADAVSWAAIGARTTESQVHRNLTSGLSMPVGFKNGTSGDVQIAIDAMQAASYPHHFMSVTEQGLAGIVETRGNRDTHVILRGGKSGTNFDSASVDATLQMLAKAGLPPRVMIDASHGNSNKDHRNQPSVVNAVAEQVELGNRGIVGMMMESFLVDGRQELTQGGDLVFGQSITDACIGWETTVTTVYRLAEAVRTRRTLAQ